MKAIRASSYASENLKGKQAIIDIARTQQTFHRYATPEPARDDADNSRHYAHHCYDCVLYNQSHWNRRQYTPTRQDRLSRNHRLQMSRLHKRGPEWESTEPYDEVLQRTHPKADMYPPPLPLAEATSYKTNKTSSSSRVAPKLSEASHLIQELRLRPLVHLTVQLIPAGQPTKPDTGRHPS